MATLSIRLPDSLHRQLKGLAKKERVSINQLISTAVAEKMSALMTEDYLESLARQGDREAFDRVLAKVPSCHRTPGTVGMKRHLQGMSVPMRMKHRRAPALRGGKKSRDFFCLRVKMAGPGSSCSHSQWMRLFPSCAPQGHRHKAWHFSARKEPPPNSQSPEGA